MGRELETAVRPGLRGEFSLVAICSLALALYPAIGRSDVIDPAGLVALATSVDTQSTARNSEPRAFVVDNVNDDGPGSLRWAMLDANDSVNAGVPDRIVFAIPGVGPHIVRLASALPAIRDAVVVDGFTQSGSSANTLAYGTDARYMVELDGSIAGPGAGILIQTANTTVRGLVIRNFAGDGIRIQGAGSNQIEGNLIGGEIGAGALPKNTGNGIAIVDSHENRVGGTDPAARNEIVGNGGRGVVISGLDTIANTVLGNRIAGNRLDGIVLEAEASRNARGSHVVPNNDLRAPILVSATRKVGPDGASEGTLIEGRLESLPLAVHRLEIFSTRAKLSLTEMQQGARAQTGSVVREGDRLVLSTSVTTQADGRAEFQLLVPPGIESRASITATLTDPAGNTSEFSTPLLAPLVSKSWNNAAGGNWNVATNWTPNGVPLAADDAVITLAGTYTVTLNVSSTVASLTLGAGSGAQTLSIASAFTLTLDGASTVNSFGILAQSNGTIAGSGSLVVNGAYNWSAGTQTGAGITTLNGAVTLSGGGTKSITSSRTLNLTATTAWTGTGAMSLGTGGVVNNSGTLESQSTASISGAGGGGTFNNSGTVRKTVGTGAFRVLSGVTAFNNTGNVEAQTGSISLETSGTHSGGFNGSGGTVQFDGGTHGLNAGASLAGTIQLASGTLNLNVPITASTFTQTGGTVQGSTTFTTTGLYTWSAGTIGGTGTSNVDGGLVVNGNTTKTLTGGRTLNNPATTTWTQGTFQVASNAIVNNTGTWDCQSNDSMTSPGGTGVFNNSGTFRKSAGTGTTLLSSQLQGFHNTGSVIAQTGIIQFQGVGTHTGSFDGAGGTVLFTSSAHNLNAGTSLAGLVELGGAGTLNVNVPVNAQTFVLSGGTLQGAGSFAISGLFTWTTGQMAGSGITNANGGMLRNGSVADIRTGRTLNNSGTATVTGTGALRVEVGAVVNNSGTWDFQVDPGIAGFNLTKGSFNNLSTGTFKKSAGVGVTSVDIPFTNAGSVEALSGTLDFIHSPSGFTQTGGSTTLNGGVVKSTATMNIQGGTFAGIGTATANVTSAGQVAPGVPLGILNLSGNYTQSAAGALNVKIGGLNPGTDYDQFSLLGSGVASLAGTLNVSLANGYVAVGGSTFTVMTFTSRTGTFSAFTPPAVNCVGWVVRHDPTAVVLNTVTLPTEIGGQLIAANKTTISWAAAPVYPGTTYDLLRGRVSTLPVGSQPATESCVAQNVSATQATDLTTPAVGTSFWYLVRERVTGCGIGTYGKTSGGTDRISTVCP